MNMARCLIFQSGLTPCFWARALSTACYIRNRCPSSTLKWVTPYEMIYETKPKVGHFRIFGSDIMVLDKSPTKGKLDPRATQGVFIGHSKRQKGYLVCIANERKVICTRDVKFINECEKGTAEACEDLLITPRSDSDLPRAITDIDEIQVHSDNQIAENSVNGVKLKRTRGRPRIIRDGKKGRPRKEYCAEMCTAPDNELHSDTNELVNEIHDNVPECDENDCDNPRGAIEVCVNLAEVDMNEALQGSDTNEWLEAIEHEVVNILKYDTWDIIKQTNCKNVVGCRFVLTNKCGQNGTVERRKARLVAKGYNQEFGVDYYNTYAPVARLETLRLLLALSIQCKFSIWQFDVVSAYLNGVLEEKILMKIPNMFKLMLDRILRHQGVDSLIGSKAKKMLQDLAEGGNVCLLRKALYGLKQAGRQWYSKISEKLKSIGLTCATNEPCLFFGHFNDHFMLLLLYVDDMLVACGSSKTVEEIKHELSNDFEMKDFGLAKYCLGLELEQSNEYVKLLQKGYIDMLLKPYGMYGCNSVSTPSEANFFSELKQYFL